MIEKRYLYRDTENQKIFGVAKGLADYFELDVTLVRVVWLVLLFCVGTGLLAYLIMAIVVEPKNVVMARVEKERQKAAEDSGDPFSKYDK